MLRPAALFDLDGVISDTASVHAKAWRIVFDDALTRLGIAHRPFDEKNDYAEYVDGKMRQAGIESFLASREVVLPLGNSDQKDLVTVNGIGNTKNAIFRDLIASDGIAIFDDSRRLISRLMEAGFELGIASSSKNAGFVLERSGLLNSFKAIMDGLVAEQNGVKSKPDPEFYRHAASLIGHDPGECVVIEDAVSGVTSAKRAGIKFVIGIVRGAHRAEVLRGAGADLVVHSLDDVATEVFLRGNIGS